MTEEIKDIQDRIAEIQVAKERRTPGPWRWNRDGQLEGPDGQYVLFGCCDDPHCDASIDGKAPDLALIAAAPDMYAALEELRAYMVSRGLMPPDDPHYARSAAAIEKAEGRKEGCTVVQSQVDGPPCFNDEVGCESGDAACGFVRAGVGWQCKENDACGRFVAPGEKGHAFIENYHAAQLAKAYGLEVEK
jgi:hypothetical protein